MLKGILFLTVMILCGHAIYAQHEHHPPSAKKDTSGQTNKESKTKKRKTQDKHQVNTGMHQHKQVQSDTGMHMMDIPMSHAFSLNLPMTRNGSGTGWLPDASPMYGYMLHSRKWMYMAHANLFFRYNEQNFNNSRKRGDSRFDAPTWFMFMGQRKVGSRGLFHFNTMLSLDPFIQGGKGYPLLFQSGESYQGKSLIDRQHPHDLFSELSDSYSYAINEKVDAFVYVGYPGEPALGPVTFMHRPSALDNPNSPISHHWVDATHITFGVVTGAIRVGKFKVEGSSFTGREPDEERYGFDKPRFDSRSARLSFNPNSNWALQVSHGFVKSPEELHSEDDVYKTTASAVYSHSISSDQRIDATLLWGLNKQKTHEGENAVMAEASWRKRKAAAYARYEFTEKSAEELVLPPNLESHEIFGIHAMTVGLNYDLLEIRKTRVAAGGQWSVYGKPRALDPFYGNNPMSIQLYLRIYPSLMKMNMASK